MLFEVQSSIILESFASLLSSMISLYIFKRLKLQGVGFGKGSHGSV